MQSNRLIAYNILEKNIIRNGFCTGCGACEAACPMSALHVEDEQVKRLYDCSESLDLCTVCYEICPHSEFLLLRSLEAVSEAPLRSEALGYFRKILLAQSNDPKIREKSHDGAVVTSLLMFGLNNKMFDSAIVSPTEDANPLKPIPSVVSVPDDIFSSIGSKFFPSAVVKAYGDAVLRFGKKEIATVGVPCHILGLRKIDAWKHKISGKSKISIGLFCFGTFSSTGLFRYLTETYKVAPSEIRKMYLSHDFMVETEKGVIEIPLSRIMQYVLPSCRTCIDLTSEVADISIGSAYPLKDWSVVIIRTKSGEDFFFDAVEKGVINTRSIEQEPKVFERVIIAALNKRTAGFVEASKLEEANSFTPVRLLRETDELAGVKVEDIMTRRIRTVPSDMTVSQLLDLMAAETHIGYPVVNENGELSGIVTIEEASKVDKTNRWKTSVGSIARQNVDVCFPGETALDAFKKMTAQETGRVLVLDPADPKQLIGIISKRDLMHVLIERACKKR